MADELKRDVRFVPGFDKRSKNPDYGISGGRFIFVVSGSKGAVHFVMSADFYPATAIEHLIRHYNNDARSMMRTYGPMGFDVGYHAPSPQWEGQEVAQDACEWLDGKPCYSDGSALRADEWCKEFLREGTEWLWPALEQEYHDRFAEPAP